MQESRENGQDIRKNNRKSRKMVWKSLSSPEPQMTPVTAGSALARHAPGAIWGRAYVIWCAIFSVHSHLEFLRPRHIVHAGGLRTQNRPYERHAMLPGRMLYAGHVSAATRCFYDQGLYISGPSGRCPTGAGWPSLGHCIGHCHFTPRTRHAAHT